MRRLVALSSTVNTRRPCSASTSTSLAVAVAAFWKGISTQNVLPIPGSLRISTVPPIRLTSSRVIVSPRPVPPKRRVVLPSACVKLSNTALWRSSEMPMPVSRTENRIVTTPDAS